MAGNKALQLLKRRLWLALKYSIAGLVTCFRREEAFRCEVVLAVILLPLAFWLGRTAVEHILMVMVVFGVLITELLNTGLEAAFDRFGSEFHDLAKYAKDAGSAAVFLSMMLFLIVWGSVLWHRY